MLNHADRTVKAEDGGDRKWGHGRAVPYEPRLVIDVQAYDFASRCEVHSGPTALSHR